MSEYSCPHCKNPVYDDEALLCLYCGQSLGRSVGVMGKFRLKKPKVFLIAMVVLIFFSFLFFMMR